MTASPSDPAVRPADLRLRPNPRPAVRLSRKVLIGLSLVGGIALGGALMLALQPPAAKTVKPKEPSTSTRTRPSAELFNRLPKDYAAAPQLGAPLPGDLGKPILDAQQGTSPGTGAGIDATASSVPASSPSSVTGTSAQSQAVSAAQQARDAARASQLFASGRAGSAASKPDSGSGLPMINADFTPISGPTAGSPAAISDRKLSFLNQAPDRLTVSPDRLQAPASPYLLQAGSIIPAALITGLRSDLPGQVTAQVSENVYDSLTGIYLLVPQGSRLIGQYDNAVAFGQSRVLLAWTRLILPNGRSLVLEKLSAADPRGLAGLEDQTDYHWSGMLQAAALSTLLSVGAEAGSSDRDSEIVRALRAGASDSIARTGQQIVERQLNIKPTLTIRSGFPVRVILSRDLVLEPYGEP